MSNESISTASGSNPHDPPHDLEASEDIFRQTDSDFAAKIDTLTSRVNLFVKGQEEVKQALVLISKLPNTLVASINAVKEKMVTMEAVDAQLLTDIEALRESFLASVRNLRAGLPQTGDGQISRDSGDSGDPKCIDKVVNEVSEEKAQADDLAHSATTREAARVEAEAQKMEDLDRLVNEVNRQVDSVISQEEVGLELACTNELANTLVASIDSLNGNLVTMEAKETQVRSDIEALRDSFLASVRNLRAELPQTGDNQILRDLGAPNAMGERIGGSSTQMGTLPGVESAEISEALEELDSTSARITFEMQGCDDENEQGLDPKCIDIIDNKVSEEKASADNLAHSATTSEAARVEAEAARVEAEAARVEAEAARVEAEAARVEAEAARVEAEAARVEAEAQEQQELDRLIRLYLRENQLEVIVPNQVMTPSELEEERLKQFLGMQFLTERLRFLEEENFHELARLYSVMLDNLCPRIVKHGRQLRKVHERKPENLMTAEFDLLAHLKAYGHYVDAAECYKAEKAAGNLERAQKYIQNCVQNYTDNQTAIRAGRAVFEGKFEIKNLCAHICEKAKTIDAESLDWKVSKKFFEEAEDFYREAERCDKPTNQFFAYAYGQLARHETSIFKVDGHVMSKLLNELKVVEEKIDMYLYYIFLVFSVCTV